MEEIDKRIVEVARSAVKEYLERLMNTERDVFIEEHGGLRNGFHERKVKTKFREIEDLSVPRDREGRFRSAALEPYSRSIGLEELIISLYSKGVSTRKASEILEEIFQSRPLESGYIAIFLDALSFFLRRDTVEKEPILFAMGIRESGEYEIPGFCPALEEPHRNYVAVIKDLYDRGVRKPLLFVADGLPKIDKEVTQVFPRADFQLCRIDASRNLESEVRESDKLKIDREQTKRMNNEVRRRIKIIDSIHIEESALKIVYLRVAKLNEKWFHRVLNGYLKARTSKSIRSAQSIREFTHTL